MERNLYEHECKYYETDQMGIIHHSNYIRFMEEARIAFLKQIGFPMEKIEAELNGRTPDYLVVHHMEPDHSANIAVFMEKFKEAKK